MGRIRPIALYVGAGSFSGCFVGFTLISIGSATRAPSIRKFERGGKRQRDRKQNNKAKGCADGVAGNAGHGSGSAESNGAMGAPMPML